METSSGAGDQGVLCIADACGRSFSAPLNVVVLLSLVLSSALNSTVVVAGDTRFSRSECFDSLMAITHSGFPSALCLSFPFPVC